MKQQSKPSNDNKPVVIDVYSGVGGLSLGAARAGFSVAAAVDNDRYAIETHSRNFPDTTHISRSVTKLAGVELLELAGLRRGQLDGLIGGPPCQGFSFIGRRDIDDSRNTLFSQFFRLVSEMQPKFYIAENVPGILNDRFSRRRTAAFARVKDDYVMLPPIKVIASEHGVPTTRTRIFFIGYKSRWVNELNATLFRPSRSTQDVNVWEALKGLPHVIDPEWQKEEQGWREIGNVQKTTFLRKAMGHIPEGVGDQKAVERYFEKHKVSGCLGTLHEDKVVERFERLEPGEQDPISKAVRLDSKGLCPTLRAGTGKDKGSYQAIRPIHYSQPRVITPREAARLQGFPDWFVFHKTKWHSFRQIGNSVSPIVAHHLLSAISRQIGH